MLEIAAEQGIEAVERDIWPMELHAADGAFVCGSGAGIVPIGSFDGRPVTQPDHPLIERIQEAYRERTRSTTYRTELYVGTLTLYIGAAMRFLLTALAPCRAASRRRPHHAKSAGVPPRSPNVTR